MKTTGSKAILNILEKKGTRFIFGIPGVSTLSIYDAMIGSNIKPILTTHELNASFMADAYSRVTNEVGVCLTIPGPGLLNMLTGIAEAFHDSSPMIVIIAKDNQNQKSFKLHECDHKAFLSTIIKGFFSINKFKDISSVIPKAFVLSKMGEPGPVAIEIDTNVFEEKGYLNFFEFKNSERSFSSSDEKTIENIVKQISNSQTLGIYAGKGAFGATNEILELSSMTFAPVASTISGKGVIPEDHELSVGFGFGPGRELAQDLFKKCETILAIGCKFSELSTGGYNIKLPKTLIHIDINPNVIGANYKPQISLVMDSKTALTQIIKNLKIIGYKSSKKIDILRSKKSFYKKNRPLKNSTSVDPSTFFFELRHQIDRDAIITTDVGNHNFWAIHSFNVFKPKTFISPTNFQSMGFGIPAAVASKLAFPQKQVICICGDGGFKMSSFELLTAKMHDLNPLICIFKDNALGTIKEIQKLRFGRNNAVNFENIDLKHFANLIGAKFLKIESNDKIIDVLKQSIDLKVLTLIEINVEYSKISPLIKGISKAKFKNSSFLRKIKLLSEVVFNQISRHFVYL